MHRVPLVAEAAPARESLQQRRASSQRFCWRPRAQKASHTKPVQDYSSRRFRMDPDLKAAVANGTFRQDLLYRPVEYFVQRYANREGRNIRSNRPELYRGEHSNQRTNTKVS